MITSRFNNIRDLGICQQWCSSEILASVNNGGHQGSWPLSTMVIIRVLGLTQPWWSSGFLASLSNGDHQGSWTHTSVVIIGVLGLSEQWWPLELLIFEDSGADQYVLFRVTNFDDDKFI